MYNSKTAKPPYYKQHILTYVQLEKAVVRLLADTRMGNCTKQQHVQRMFAQYKNNTLKGDTTC